MPETAVGHPADMRYHVLSDKVWNMPYNQGGTAVHSSLSHFWLRDFQFLKLFVWGGE